MRGPFLVEWHLLRRGLLSWISARLAFAIALLLSMEPPWANGGVIALGIVALSAVLGLLETQRVHERVLLANLGVTLSQLVTLLAVPALLGEMVLMVLLP